MHDVEQTRERIVAHRSGRTSQGAEIPMIVRGVSAEVVCVGRDSGEHGARSFVPLYLERIAIAATADLELLSAAHEVIVGRIEREEHADSAFGVGVQHDEVTILRALDVHAGAVAGVKLIVIEPNGDWILSE